MPLQNGDFVHPKDNFTLRRPIYSPVGPWITDASAVHLGKLKRLQWLDLGGSELTDEGLAHLAGLESMYRLNLRDAQVTDRGVQHLAPMRNLTELGLQGTKVTGTTMDFLLNFQKFRWVDLQRTAVTLEDVQDFIRQPRREGQPRFRISFGDSIFY